jgi:uncharacterized membrane protein
VNVSVHSNCTRNHTITYTNKIHDSVEKALRIANQGQGRVIANSRALSSSLDPRVIIIIANQGQGRVIANSRALSSSLDPRVIIIIANQGQGRVIANSRALSSSLDPRVIIIIANQGQGRVIANSRALSSSLDPRVIFLSKFAFHSNEKKAVSRDLDRVCPYRPHRS